MDAVSKAFRLMLEKTDAPIFGIVSKKALENLLKDEFVWPWYGQLMKLPQTIAYMLQINFWLSHYKVTVL
jgi:asparagine synthase (glutamine-hydrolysing)